MPLISETSAFKLDEIDGFDDNYSLPVPAQFVNAATIGFTLLLAPSLRRLRTNTMDIFMGLVPRVFPNLRELEFEYNCDDGPLPRFFPSRSQCPVLAHFVVTDAYCSDIESILDWCPPNVTLHVLLSDEDDTSPFPVSESLPHSFSLMKRTIVILENRCCRPQIELETARNYLQWCVSDLDVAVTLDFQSQICHSCEIGADTSSECSERESEESNKSSKRKRRKRRKTGRKQVRDREERRKASMARKEKYNGVHKKKEEGRLNVRTSKTRNIAKSRRDDDDEEDEEEAQVLKEMRFFFFFCSIPLLNPGSRSGTLERRKEHKERPHTNARTNFVQKKKEKNASIWDHVVSPINATLLLASDRIVKFSAGKNIM